MIIAPRKDAEWCANQIYNGMIDIISEREKENAKRTKLFQPPLPQIEIDVKDMIIRTGKLARETYETALSQRQNPKGDAETWEAEALKRLRDNLLYFAKDSNNPVLNRQIWAAWPETAPPPNLTAEQKEKLLELQARADELQENLTATISDALDELSRLISEEVALTKGTAAAGLRFIRNQAGWYKTALTSLILEHNSSPVPYKKHIPSRPCGWTREVEK